jgi:hypothetical protein
MAMRRIVANIENDEHVKPMHRMENGEVCYVLSHKHYVVKVQELFLILDDDKDDYDIYGHNCDSPVRELAEGESVTVNFY